MSEQTDDDDDLHKQQYLDALGVFVDKYEPAKQSEVTDYFSSTEINSAIKGHTGVDINLKELHTLMLQMGFNYELQENQFVWLCYKRS